MAHYEMVVGMEVHAQLRTKTKIFCSCPVRFAAEPNSSVCPVCLGLPGVLPVLNDEAVRLAIRTGLALGCTIARRSRFARKHYFYPDLPKGFQITQYTEPLAENGFLDIPGKRVRVRRCHIEEDAGKLIHAPESSLVDFNRCGVPLIEIVTEPDLRSSEEAVAYLGSLRQILQYLGVSDGDMEKGHFRCECNVSVRPEGSSEFLTQTEVKNLNSLRAVREALDYEAQRQTGLHEQGGKVEKQTLLWDEVERRTRPMRSKETAEDYRYFPEPDLPPLVISDAEVEAILAGLPELPARRRNRYVTELGLSEYDAAQLTATSETADYYEALLRESAEAKPAANWLLTEVAAQLNAQGTGIEQFRVRPPELAELLNMVKASEITGKAAKEVFAEMAAQGGKAREIVRVKGLGLVQDDEALSRAADEVIAAESGLVEKYRSGKTTVLAALVGAVLKKSRGRFLPQKVSEILTRKLN